MLSWVLYVWSLNVAFIVSSVQGPQGKSGMAGLAGADGPPVSSTFPCHSVKMPAVKMKL